MFRFLAIALLFLLSFPLYASSAEWRTEYPHPWGVPNFVDIWVSDTDTVYAASATGMIFSNAGGKWTQMPVPESVGLKSIWGFSDNDIYAVAAYATLLHYDGTKWEKTQINDSTDWLIDIWGSDPDNLYITAGDAYDNGKIYHRTKYGWECVYSSRSTDLSSLWGTSPNNIYAVGRERRGGIALHYDGYSWNKIYASPLESFAKVWGLDSKNVYIGGTSGSLLHFNGETWRNIFYGKSDPGHCFVKEITGSSPNDITIVRYASVWHYNGLSWQEYRNSPTPYSCLSTLSTGELIAGGYYSIIAKGQWNNWKTVLSGTLQGFDSVWGSSSDDVYITSDGGKIRHYDGKGWSTPEDAPQYNITSVWGNSATDVYFSEWSGVSHFNGETWARIKIGKDLALRAIKTHPSGSAWVCGDNGKLFTLKDGMWSEIITAVNNDLFAIWPVDKDTVFVVGDHGTILKVEGTECVKMKSNATGHLRDVWGTSDKNMYATGGWDKFFHYNGTSWNKVSITKDSFWPMAIWGFSENDIYVAGVGGGLSVYTDRYAGSSSWKISLTKQIGHFNGSDWTISMADPTGNYRAIWGTSPTNLYAVGLGSIISHYSKETKCSAPPSAKQPGLANVSTTSSIEHDWDQAILKDKYKVSGNVETVTNVREFTATTNMANQNAIFTFRAMQLDGIVGDMQFLKLKEDGTNLPYKYDSLGGLNSPEGSWWIQDTNKVVFDSSDTLYPTKSYDIYFMIKDNGDYDLNPTDGAIHDPVALVKSSSTAVSAASKDSVASEKPTSDSSSPGCIIGGTTSESDLTLPTLLLLSLLIIVLRMFVRAERINQPTHKK
ncbi:hypothetical protein [Maridesulfovibrio ferrireducens]|uniref:hypothetical protein n=1 Tax=Maridesulfovibrio ferrireducens TaxID=246191 RepID=UPI001A18F1E2|nr:hypothetical protein [Maridesulfovibrio ferrireducens]MBI9112947.1 hypothetical protein [Maridesulfovibrio ferrireducens]